MLRWDLHSLCVNLNFATLPMGDLSCMHRDLCQSQTCCSCLWRMLLLHCFFLRAKPEAECSDMYNPFLLQNRILVLWNLESLMCFCNAISYILLQYFLGVSKNAKIHGHINEYILPLHYLLVYTGCLKAR